MPSYLERSVYHVLTFPCRQKHSSLIKYVEGLREANLDLVHDHSGQTRQISDLVQDIHVEATKVLANEDDNDILIASISQQLKKLSASSGRHYLAEHLIVESLYYESSSVRHESIPDAHKNTLNWLVGKYPKKKSKRVQYPKVSLLDWLRTGNGIYWVSGKPGSGKSTLMKFIADHPETQSALDEWAGQSKCMVASYYFWSAGTRLQKTIEGLLRSLLFDIFVRHPHSIPIAVPDRWDQLSGKHLNGVGHVIEGRVAKPWTVPEMSRALERLSPREGVTQHLCLFIDGLDEYDGDHLHVVRLLKQLSERCSFKLCVSSRPWNVFEDELGLDATKKLYVHELTYHDIRQYITSTLQEDPHWKSGACVDLRYKNLVDDITAKAQGVFLWVVLVVRSVLDGLSNGDSIKLLEQRMRELPQDLGPFFRHILTSISPIYHQQMALYFKVLLDAPHVLTLMHYSFLEQCFELNGNEINTPIKPMDNYDIFNRHTMMRRRLNARCKGLVESHLNPPETRAYLAHQVTFLHRTVRDFLRTDEMARFMTDILGEYPANTAVLIAYTAFIKALPSSGPVKEQLREALVYAARAEDESPETVVACVDELHRTMTTLSLTDPDEMAKLVVRSGLREYVRQSINDRSAGFEDASWLLKSALSAAANPETQTDMAPLVTMLLDAGAELDDRKWSRYIQTVGANVKRWQDLDLVLRQRRMINLLLPVVKTVDGNCASDDVPWGTLFTELVLDEWKLMPRSVVDTRIEIIQALFAHGASPNAPYASTTVWLWFCSQLRQPASTSIPVRAEALAKCTEILVNSGADLSSNGSLTPSEVTALLPGRLAGRITEAMAQRSKAVLVQSYGVKTATWVRWMASWVWGRT